MRLFPLIAAQVRRLLRDGSVWVGCSHYTLIPSLMQARDARGRKMEEVRMGRRAAVQRAGRRNGSWRTGCVGQVRGSA